MHHLCTPDRSLYSGMRFWVGACAQMQAASGKLHTWLDLGRLAGLSVIMSRLWLELMSRAMLGQCCCGPAAAPSLTAASADRQVSHVRPVLLRSSRLGVILSSS